MRSRFEPWPLVGRNYALPSGQRVRLRLARARDAAAVGALFEQAGVSPEQLDLARFVRFDPRERLVVCACSLIGLADSVVGVGAIELGAAEPLVLLTDPQFGEELRELLRDCLVGRARAVAERHAA